MDLSVVIPTRDRRERLLRTLTALDRQRLGDVSAELVVVDDGSTDGTSAALSELGSTLPLQAITQARGGASRARNAGIDAASGTVILMLGDDTVPASPDLLARHAALHRASPDPRDAVLGRIEWAPHVERTDFLAWLDREGFQYHYDRIDAGAVEPSRHLYSSHASIKRSLLLEVGKFDEELTFLGEDTELGIRLGHAGIRLEYHPELLVHHDHPQTVEGYARRMEVAGRAARRIHDRWPQEGAMDPPTARQRLYPLIAPMARGLLRAGLGGWTRERAWSVILMAAYARGYRDAGA